MPNVPQQNPLSVNLSQIPHDFGMGRLHNDSLIFDNLADRVSVDYDPVVHFPIKVETFFSVVLLEGCMKLMVNLQHVEVKGGQVLAIMPESIFQVEDTSEDMRFFCLMITPEFTEEMRKNIGVHIDLTKRYYNYAVHTLEEEALQNGLMMYRLIKREMAQPDYPHKRDVIQRYCEIWALKSFSRGKGEEQPEMAKTLTRREQIFHDFLALLEENYKRERSISYYADRMCLTPKYLSTTIKEVSGKHGMQWVDDYVALEAKALLRNSSLTVKQVSDELNFPSQSMFGRFFKKMTGYSPKQYKLL